jgi:histidine triad (HIT) family protein
VTRDCIFCSIVAGDAPAHVIHEDERTVSFLDINPVTRGHTLVVPRRHVVDMWDVDEDTAVAVMRSARHVAQLLRRALDPEGCNLFQATRAIAGQTVFHLHLHVLPRSDPSELQVSLEQRGAEPDELAAVADRVRAVTEDADAP